MQNAISPSRFAAVLVAAGALLSASPVTAAPYSALVVEADSGKVLYEESADEPRYPASLTKMMTLYLAFEALRDGRLSLGQPLFVSAAAASRPPSKLGLRPGDSITVNEAISALVTLSANDAASVLAEAMGGSEDNFARMMTAKARSLGMTQTYFRNASGLPDPFQVTTAWDMFKLARALRQNMPQYYPYFSKDSFYFRGRVHRNHNHLLTTYPGTDGIKTGYIRNSGFNLVASTQRNGHRLIGVVFGGATARSRDQNMRDILDMSFAQVGVSGPSLQYAYRPYSAGYSSATPYARPSGYVSYASTRYSTPTTLYSRPGGYGPPATGYASTAQYARSNGYSAYPSGVVATSNPAPTPAVTRSSVDSDRFNGAYAMNAAPSNPAPATVRYSYNSNPTPATVRYNYNSNPAPATTRYSYNSNPAPATARTSDQAGPTTVASSRADDDASDEPTPPPTPRSAAGYVIQPFIRSAEAAPAPTPAAGGYTRYAGPVRDDAPAPSAATVKPAPTDVSAVTLRGQTVYAAPPRPTLAAQPTPPPSRSMSTYSYTPPRPTLVAQPTPPANPPIGSARSGTGAPVRLAFNDAPATNSAGDEDEPDAATASGAPPPPSRYTPPRSSGAAPTSSSYPPVRAGATAVGARSTGGGQNIDLVGKPMYDQETDSESSEARPDLTPKSVAAPSKPAPAAEKKPAPAPKPAAVEPAVQADQDEDEPARPAPRPKAADREPVKTPVKTAAPAKKEKEKPSPVAENNKQVAARDKGSADAGRKTTANAKTPATKSTPDSKTVAQATRAAKPVAKDKAAPAAQRVAAASAPTKAKPGTAETAAKSGAARGPAVAQTDKKGGDYRVQVGAFSSKADAAKQLSKASQASPELSRSRAEVTPVVKDGKTLYRASFKGLKQDGAGSACQTLKRKQKACLVSSKDG